MRFWCTIFGALEINLISHLVVLHRIFSVLFLSLLGSEHMSPEAAAILSSKYDMKKSGRKNRQCFASTSRSSRRAREGRFKVSSVSIISGSLFFLRSNLPEPTTTAQAGGPKEPSRRVRGECETNYDWRVMIKFRVCVIMLSNMFIPPAMASIHHLITFPPFGRLLWSSSSCCARSGLRTSSQAKPLPFPAAGRKAL